MSLPKSPTLVVRAFQCPAAKLKCVSRSPMSRKFMRSCIEPSLQVVPIHPPNLWFMSLFCNPCRVTQKNTRGHIEMPPKRRNVLLSRIGGKSRKLQKVENFAVSIQSVLCFGLLHRLVRHVLPRCIFLGPFQRNTVGKNKHVKTNTQTHQHNPQSITGTQNGSCLL